MAMYEVEDLVEKSIRLTDNSIKAAEEKRNLIWNLYMVQNKFDCSFTHLRVFEILRKYDFVQAYAIDDYPAFKKHPQYLKELAKKDFEFILLDPDKSFGTSNPAVAYWIRQEEKIFVDFGSIYFSAPGAPTPLNAYALAREMVEEAGRQHNKLLVYSWPAFMLLYSRNRGLQNLPAAEIKEKYLKRIKDIYHSCDFSDVKPLHPFMALKNDTGWIEHLPEEIDPMDIELIRWFVK